VTSPTSPPNLPVALPEPQPVQPRQLREYQDEAYQAVECEWNDPDGADRLGVALPTGVGKSTIIAKLAVNAFYRGQTVVALVHRYELMGQIRDAIFAVDPALPQSTVGLVQGELDDHAAPIVIATLQTLRSAYRQNAVGQRDIILWDEVHHAGAEGFHMTFTDLGGYLDGIKMCGFTATMRRQIGGRIGLGDVIEKVVFNRDLKWAIDSGYLVRPKGLTVRLDSLNQLAEVRTVAGDFATGELNRVMEAATEYVVNAIRMHASDRRPIIFAAGVEAAYMIGNALNEAGYPAVTVTGEQKPSEREPLYQAYRDGDVRAMVTVMVLTEGADFPMCDCVVLARPTQSTNLYTQMIGRALRLYTHPGTGEEKTDALVLDLTGSARHMRLTSLPQILPGVATRVVGGDGEDIIEPEQTEEEIEVFRRPRQRRQGPVEMVSIDIITGHTREVLWLDTLAGMPFVSLNQGWVVFLWPRNGIKTNTSEWAVANINTKTGEGGWMDQSETYMRLDVAIEYAERRIPEAGFQLPQRGARWRTDNRAPSIPQLSYARALGIVAAEDMTKSRLRDEISIVLASRVIDPAVHECRRQAAVNGTLPVTAEPSQQVMA
jgi:superfamily II DNA or RNA helicase